MSATQTLCPLIRAVTLITVAGAAAGVLRPPWLQQLLYDLLALCQSVPV